MNSSAYSKCTCIRRSSDDVDRGEELYFSLTLRSPIILFTENTSSADNNGDIKSINIPQTDKHIILSEMTLQYTNNIQWLSPANIVVLMVCFFLRNNRLFLVADHTFYKSIRMMIEQSLSGVIHGKDPNHKGERKNP